LKSGDNHTGQIHIKTKMPNNHLMHPVQQGISYLLATYEEEHQAWPIIPPEANNDPRAPWWNYEKSAEFFGDFLANPRAAIVGYLHDYNAQVPTDLLEQLTASVIDHLESLPDDKMDMHDLLCAICLAESATLRSGLGYR
jgi:hypothetical protein